MRRFKLPISIGVCILGLLATLVVPKGQPFSRDPLKSGQPFDLRISVREPGVITRSLPDLSPDNLYSFSLSVQSPMTLGQARIRAILRDPRQQISGKTIHLGDPDFYISFRPAERGEVKLELSTEGTPNAPVQCEIRLISWRPLGKDLTRLEAEPNDTWQQANTIELGETVYATADDAPYILAGKDQPSEVLNRGVDWYRLEVKDDKRSLVFFEIDLQERDNIPMDVSVHRLQDGAIVPYETGMDPVSPPHEVQALPGNKFTTRVLSQGSYFVRVAASHPAYSLRTESYELPPYSDPRRAIRAGMDYLAAAGDSWHANTPRRGGVTDRVSNYHAETSTCIACHPTHFSTRGNLIANANGYPIRMRRELQFLTERLYNNPRPFYGFPEASWSRLISAPANVLSRLASLLNYFEHNVSGEQRTSLLKGVAEYLKLYYRDRTSLPPDETNGNTPIVSAYEVAFYSWMVFDELHKRTGEPDYAAYRDRVRKLLEETKHKNMLDLCYQTIALATIDKQTYAARISANAERILSLQRGDGQWAMLFEESAPAAEFQTGHCLYALALAGYGANEPRIAKGLQYLLNRQQNFGGWFDPAQSYENFRTPFRETQFAVMAFSEYFKGPGGKGWGAGFPKNDSNPALDFREGLSAVLKGLDGVWERPTEVTARRIESLGQHPEPLVRQAALITLGRVGGERALPILARGLSDPQKMVQNSAAWALRQLASRKGLGLDAIATTLSNENDRARWGASRVFATHFSYLSGNLELGSKLLKMMQDPSPVLRMQACKALWQWWYWNASPSFRDSVENAFLERMAVERDPWVRRNLTEGFYNICDDNVRYLYNNWIPLLARSDDRERASAGHQAVGTSQARKIAKALSQDNELLRDGILESLTQFHLRHSDPARPEFYARIGNDVETIKFYSEAASILEPVFAKLIQHPSPAVRGRVVQASAVVRDNSMNLFAPAVVGCLADADPEVRAIASRFYKILPLPLDDAHQGATVALLSKLLSSEHRTANLAALDLVASTKGRLAEEAELARIVKTLTVSADPGLKPAALRAATSFPSLLKDPEVVAVVKATLETAANDPMPEDLLAIALEMAYADPTLSSQIETTKSLERLLAKRDGRVWKAILNIAERNSSARANLQVISVISEALVGKDEALSRQAREIAGKNPAVARNPGVAAAIAELAKRTPKDAAPKGKESYTVPAGKVPETAGSASLDYGYFVERIMPILRAAGPDGMACVQCHASHTILKLKPPSIEGNYTDEILRENYRAALRVVDLENPENSLILRKPLSTAEAEGTIGSGRLSHGGGPRWSGPDDPSYKTILEWIRGARLVSAREQ